MGLCIRQTGSISAFPREGGGGKRQDRQTSLISRPICTPLHGCLLSSSFHLLHRTSCKLEHSSSSRGETLSPLISQIGLHQTLKTRRRDRIGWSCNTHFFRSFFLSFFLSFSPPFLPQGFKAVTLAGDKPTSGPLLRTQKKKKDKLISSHLISSHLISSRKNHRSVCGGYGSSRRHFGLGKPCPGRAKFE